MPETLNGVKLVKLKAGSLSDFTLPPPEAPESVGRTMWQGTLTHHRTVWDFLQ